MSYKKNLGIAIISSLILGACTHVATQPADPATSNIDMTPAADNNESPEAMMTDDSATVSADTMIYTLEDIAAHNTPQDCWFALHDKVYDVTTFIASGNHPGKAAILEGCGLDATQLFETRPMGSGTPHSDTARSFLPNFEIGVLAQ